MPAVGAATSWLYDSPVVEPLRLRRVPLLTACACFALGDLLALRWQPTLLLAAAALLLLALSLLALRKTPRIAIVPVYALWIATGCWCAQIEPAIPQQSALHHLADGLTRDVQGTVIRVRTHPPTPPSNPTPGRPMPTLTPTRSQSTSTSSPSNTSRPTSP